MTDTVPSQTTQTTKPVERKDGSHLVACYVNDYETLFAKKQEKLRGLLYWDKEIDAFESTREHFRMRTNFQMWHDDGKKKTPEGFYYAMFDENDPKHTPYEIKTFPRGTKRINELMQIFLDIFPKNKVIFEHLFEVRFLTTKLNKESLVVLCYKRPLHGSWLEEAEKIAKEHNLKIIGRARKMMQMTGIPDDEYIEEQLSIEGKSYTLFQTEGAFSQPNAYICEKMITWALHMTKSTSEESTADLLELYCGGGTFTLPLAQNFRKVLATEISKSSVALAKRCLKVNNIENIKVLRLSSEEFTQFYLGQRKFQRLDSEHVDIHDYNIQAVLVDPPRAGLDLGTCQLIAMFPKIVYISCNPVTLARDVEILKKTHDLVRVAAFDQFPYTEHLESGVVLVKKAVEHTPVSEEIFANHDTDDNNTTKKPRLE
jgi:tRNA (uracil-5-)-methyltransferase